MAIVAHAHPFVIGVDTFPATAAGMSRAVDWVGDGPVATWRRCG